MLRCNGANEANSLLRRERARPSRETQRCLKLSNAQIGADGHALRAQGWVYGAGAEAFERDLGANGDVRFTLPGQLSVPDADVQIRFSNEGRRACHSCAREGATVAVHHAAIRFSPSHAVGLVTAGAAIPVAPHRVFTEKSVKDVLNLTALSLALALGSVHAADNKQQTKMAECNKAAGDEK
jgi:hypothetical protein